MLDIKYIRENLEAVRNAAKVKRVKVDLDKLIAVDDQRRELITKSETIRAEKNKASGEIPKMATGPEKQALLDKMKSYSEEEKVLSEELKLIETEFTQLMLLVPAVPSDKAPVGKDDTENVELYKVGTPTVFNGFEPKDHVTLGEELDLIDIPRGVKIAGSRSYFLKGDGLLLENAVMRMTIDHLVSKGFTPFSVPLMVNNDAMTGTGYFPGGEESAYKLERDDLNLIGTSEVSLTSYHRDEILSNDELPKLYAGLSSCFRREAGTYGKDTRGLYRVHQFTKVEQVVVCKNDLEESQKMFDLLLTNAKEILEKLGLAYRVVAVCTGDMGQGQVYKNDIETWMPSRNGYGETHSCSMFFDFQARRLNLRYRDEQGKTKLAYTLNNTCIASPRVLIPLLECYQNADGSITIPEALRPYMNGRTKIEPKKK
ncbi:MAG: serine--tRNA ligase [Candidatus Gracilibacteria bacterium]